MIDDKYTYPGLDEAMNDLASAGAASLRQQPVPAVLDFISGRRCAQYGWTKTG